MPNAPQSCVVGRHADAIKIKLRAPAREGRANEELLRFLAEVQGVARANLRLVRGDKSRQKVVSVEGLDADGVEWLLACAGALPDGPGKARPL